MKLTQKRVEKYNRDYNNAMEKKNRRILSKDKQYFTKHYIENK